MTIAPLPPGPFDVIAADPSWQYVSYSAKGLGRAPESHYRTMPLDQICALPVADVAAPNCHLVLWITGNMLAAGHHVTVCKAWGFKPTAIFSVWVKKNDNAEDQLWKRFRATGKLVISRESFFMGLGKTTRQNAEFVVLGRRGSPKRHSKAVRQVMIDPRREHSRKPETFYSDVEAYGGPDARRLDMFARKSRPGWISWGDQKEYFDEVEA